MTAPTVDTRPAPAENAATSWPAFVEEIGEIYRLTRKPDTARRTIRVLEELAACGVAAPTDLTPLPLARWMASPLMAARAPLTRKTLLNVARRVCLYAKGRGYIAATPFEAWSYPVPGRRKTRDRHHPAAELAAVLGRLDSERREARVEGGFRFRSERLYALFCVAAFTGARKMEILRLRREDFDLAGGVISIVDRGGRNTLKTEASAAPIPMADFLVDAMREWLPQTGSDWAFPATRGAVPWTSGKPGSKPLDRLKAAGLRAGVEGLTFLSLRHSWATHAESLWGFSEALIQRVLRHTTPRTAREHYRHADAANLRAMVRGIGFGPTNGPETAVKTWPKYGQENGPNPGSFSARI